MSTRRRVGVIHVHSDYSRDGRDPLEELRAFALARRLAFVGLTDHAEDLDRDRFDEYVRHCRAISDERVRLIPGLEFRFQGFTGLHLLALGLSRWIAPRTPEEFVVEARSAAVLTILAHPVLARYRLPAAVVEGIDAIEVWNAAYNTRYLPDPRAIRLLRTIRRSRPEVVGTAGLDQHDSRNDRMTRVILEGDEDDPLRTLKAGRFRNAGRTMSFGPSMEWHPLHIGALTLARWGLDLVEGLQERLARRALLRDRHGGAERGARAPAGRPYDA